MRQKYDKDIRERDEAFKAKQKGYADAHRNVKSSKFKMADTVLVKQQKINKLTPSLCPDAYTIIRIKGSMITAKANKTGTTITGNSSFFKKVPDRMNENCNESGSEYSDEMERHIDINNSVRIDNGDDVDVDVENEQILPRRNPYRVRNRPAFLRDDIKNLLEPGN